MLGRERRTREDNIMTEKEWKHIAQTILENQHVILEYILKHAKELDKEERNIMNTMLTRTEFDIVLRL